MKKVFLLFCFLLSIGLIRADKPSEVHRVEERNVEHKGDILGKAENHSFSVLGCLNSTIRTVLRSSHYNFKCCIVKGGTKKQHQGISQASLSSIHSFEILKKDTVKKASVPQTLLRGFSLLKSLKGAPSKTYTAMCDDNHGRGHWYGPIRSTREEAKKDAEKHNEAYGYKHKAFVYP